MCSNGKCGIPSTLDKPLPLGYLWLLTYLVTGILIVWGFSALVAHANKGGTWYEQVYGTQELKGGLDK